MLARLVISEWQFDGSLLSKLKRLSSVVYHLILCLLKHHTEVNGEPGGCKDSSLLDDVRNWEALSD